MGLLKARREKKVEKYTTKLRENGFNSSEIESLISIYKKTVSISNILLANIAMFIVSIIFIILAATEVKVFVDSKEFLLWLFGSISAVLVIISWILTFIVFIQVLACSITEVRKHVFIWAILSIIPLISFATLFIMKWKVGHIYKHRKR